MTDDTTPIEAPVEAALNGPSAPARARVADRAVDDPAGVEWHRKAKARWDGFMDATEGDGEAAHRAWHAYPEPLPDFMALRGPHVTVDVFGRFVQDRDTGIVHDITTATGDCHVDDIRNGTYFHFWSEAVDAIGDDIPCDLCIP